MRDNLEPENSRNIESLLRDYEKENEVPADY